MQIQDSREIRGQAIAQIEGQVRRIDEHAYIVNSQSGNGQYEVLRTEVGFICSCYDFMFRQSVGKCKHIWGVEFSLALRNKIARQVVIQPINIQACPRCNSEHIKKSGLRHNKHIDIQKFHCKNCGYSFTINLGFEGMRATPQIITSAMQLYFTGESLRNVQKFLRLQGVNKSHVAIYKWIGKYTRLMQGYLEQIKPNVSDTWRADELYVKIKGDMKYLFALMDDETRFWIAQEVADSKHRHDARKLFQLAKEATGTKPKTLITDGLPSYHLAYLREFWTNYKPRTEHINAIKFQSDANNNKMERMNGELRDREKVMRGLKKKDTPILKGYQIFHNFIREHEALEGKTPAEACGIKVEGENKWKTIIQNASQLTKVNTNKNPSELTPS